METEDALILVQIVCRVLLIGRQVMTSNCSTHPQSSENVKPRQNNRNMPTQHIATLLGATCSVRLATVLQHDMLGVIGSNLTIFKPEPTTPNMSQHIATRWPNARNILRPTMLRYVALASRGGLPYEIDGDARRLA